MRKANKMFSGLRKKNERDSFNRDWENYHKRNVNVAHQLAQKLEKPVTEITKLMYNITVQNYSQILNPIGGVLRKWEVPFVSADACDKFLTIFDLDGNLRNPSHPKSLFKLLQLMQHISRWGSSSYSSRAQLANSQYVANMKFASSYPKISSNFFEQVYKIGKLNRKPQQQQRKYSSIGERYTSAISNHIRYADNINTEREQKLKKKTFQKVRHALLPRSKSKISLISKSNIGRFKNLSKFYTSRAKKSAKLSLAELMTDDKGRRRAFGIMELDMLKSKQKFFLRLLLEKNMKDKADELINALVETELGDPLKHQYRENSVAAEISSFYSAVVAKHGHYKRAQIKWDLPFDMKSETLLQRYNNVKLPTMDRVFIVYHAPYNDNNPSAWKHNPHRL